VKKPRFYQKDHFQKNITKNQGYIIGTLGLVYGHYLLQNPWQLPMLIGGWIAVDAVFAALLNGESMIQIPRANTEKDAEVDTE